MKYARKKPGQLNRGENMETAKAIRTTKTSLRTRIAFMVLAVLATMSLTPTPANAATQQTLRFADVPTYRTDYRAINWMADRGITTGINGGTMFGPDRTVTRAEFAAFLWRYVGKPAAPTSCGFTDIATSSYAAEPACWMKANGLTTGVNKAGTLFGPSLAIPRAQATTMLWRLIGKPAATQPHGFTDVPATAYYAPAVQWFKEYGLTTGTSPTTFSPNANITRGQSALFLYRYDLSQIGVSAPGTASLDGVIGSWVGSYSWDGEPTFWETLQTGRRRSVPTATFGGVFNLKIAEPADRPVDTARIVLPSYLPNAYASGKVVGVVSGECAGSPTTSRDAQKVTLDQFYCSDADTNGVIDGVITVHLSDFIHNVQTAGPRGGFSVTYGAGDSDIRRPSGNIVAEFRADSPYEGWGDFMNPSLWQYPTQTKATTEMYNGVPTRLGAGTTTIDVNNPATASISGATIRFNNETSHLGLTFDNDIVFDERDAMAAWGGGWSVSRDPSTESYRSVNLLMVNGECSSNPSAFLFPSTIWTNWEFTGVVYGVEDTLYVDGFECKDWNNDGRINGRIGVFYQYLTSGARSFPRPYTKTLCEDTTLASIALGCIDPKDIQYLYDDDVASIELRSNGASVPVPFANTEFKSLLAEGNLAQYCSNNPTGCFPSQDYPSFMLKDQNGVYTCLLYPYLCWPQGNWPAEHQTDINKTCSKFPARCQGAESEKPKSVVPWFGVDPYSVTQQATNTEPEPLVLLGTQTRE